MDKDNQLVIYGSSNSKWLNQRLIKAKIADPLRPDHLRPKKMAWGFVIIVFLQTVKSAKFSWKVPDLESKIQEHWMIQAYQNHIKASL